MITVRGFSGTIPLLDSRVLPVSCAQVAQNVDLRSGVLRAQKGLTNIQSLTKPGALRSIYKLEDHWLAWVSQYINVVRAPITDSDNRIYFTGDGYPKQTNHTLAISGGAETWPAATRRLGINAPAAAPTFVVLGSGDGTVIDTVSYVYTLVDEYGAESAPSPATVAQDVETGQYIRLSGLVKPTLVATGNSIVYFRIYRLTAGTTGAEYLLTKMRPGNESASPVYEINPAITTAYDLDSDPAGPTSRLNEDQSDAIPSMDPTWDEPPSMDGLIQCQNNIMAGFLGNDVYFSEPGIPTAWPEDYIQTANWPVVALGMLNEYIIVLTTSFPEVIIGNDPAIFSKQALALEQGCLAKRGTVSTNEGVIYPSPYGLFIITGTSGKLVTENLYSKDQWTALHPEKIIGFYRDNKYYAFIYGTTVGYVIDFQTERVTVVDLGVTVYGGYKDPVDEVLYLLIYDGGVYYVKSFETGSLLTYTWKSKAFLLPEPENFGWGRISGKQTAGSPVTWKLYADGTLKQTKSVTDDEPFRLPGGFLARKWEFQLQGTADVDCVKIGFDRQEMMAEG